MSNPYPNPTPKKKKEIHLIKLKRCNTFHLGNTRVHSKHHFHSKGILIHDNSFDFPIAIIALFFSDVVNEKSFCQRVTDLSLPTSPPFYNMQFSPSFVWANLLSM